MRAELEQPHFATRTGTDRPGTVLSNVDLEATVCLPVSAQRDEHPRQLLLEDGSVAPCRPGQNDEPRIAMRWERSVVEEVVVVREENAILAPRQSKNVRVGLAGEASVTSEGRIPTEAVDDARSFDSETLVDQEPAFLLDHHGGIVRHLELTPRHDFLSGDSSPRPPRATLGNPAPSTRSMSSRAARKRHLPSFAV